ncbi:MAG: twin-arginine translocation signal domain-containing protein [Candidatus Eisenbacteria bacterium]
MSQTPEAPDPARRDFLKLVTAAGVAAALPQAAAALAQTPPAAGKPAAGTPPPATGGAAPAPTTPETSAPAISDDARALAAVLRRRVKAQLTDAQWDSIARDFDGDLAMGKRLRAVKFANGDEPDSTFKV